MCSVAPKMPVCLRYLFGTLQNEWSSIFVPFIIFLIESRFFACVLLHTSPRLCMEAKVSSVGSRFPLGTEFLLTALALLTAVSITAPRSPWVTHALGPRQPCLSTPQRFACEGGSIPPVTQR